MSTDECIFPNPHFRKISEHLYYCEDEEVIKAEYPISRRVIRYEELGNHDTYKSQLSRTQGK